ncbi:hypothetical protein L208DRAFT_1368186 [Tricholoma matsutake]|nr:hypothetical protein L208DRAFT_1368186 [Tricholoma matsutake 945]
MSFNDIARDEELDILNPLRHFMEQPQDNDVDPGTELSTVLPCQPHSVQNEILELYFVNDGDPLRPSVAIRLFVDASPGCGGISWPAGQVLSNYLANKGPDFVKGRAILELGSGTGLVGLVAGKLGGKVWITDQLPLLDIMCRNVKSNNLESSVTVSELNWGSPLPTEVPRPNLILAADCVYFEPAFSLLVQTLSDLADSTTEVLFCYKKRRKADRRFFVLLKKTFSWKEVTDDPNRQMYNRDGISLLRLFKTKSH